MPFYPYQNYRSKYGSYRPQGFRKPSFNRGFFQSLRKSPFRRFKSVPMKTRTVKNVQRIMISKRRLSKKSEQKWVHYSSRNATSLVIPNISDGVGVAVNMRVFWQTTGTDPDAQLYLPNPVVLQNAFNSVGAGTVTQLGQFIQRAGGENGVANDRVWYYDRLQVNFMLRKIMAVTPNVNGTQIRVLVVTQKNKNVTIGDLSAWFANGGGYLPASDFASINLPILTKDWTIRYDKVFCFGSGYYANTPTGAAAQYNFGATSVDKNFRLSVPFKYRAEVDVPTNTNWEPPLNTYFIALSNQEDSYEIREVQVIAYFHTKSI